MSRAKRISDLYDRGSDLLSSWAENGSRADLESAFECFRDLDSLVKANSQLRPAVEAHLCYCLAGQYNYSGAAADRDAAIDRLIPLLADPDPAGALDSLRVVLGQLLLDRAETKTVSEPEDLQAATDLLAIAHASSNLVEEQRTAAFRQLERAKVMLVITRAWNTLALSEIPDIDELRAERQKLSKADNYYPVLSLTAGLSLGVRSHGTGSAQDRREALGLLADGLETAGREDPWRSYALKFFALLLSVANAIDSADIPADRVLSLAEEKLASQTLDAEEEGVWHMIAFGGGLARAKQRRQTADNRATLLHLNKARGPLRSDPELSAALLGMSTEFLNERGQTSGSIDDEDAAKALSDEIVQTMTSRGWLEEIDEPDVFGQRSPLTDGNVMEQMFLLLRQAEAEPGGQIDPTALATAAESLLKGTHSAEGIDESNPLYWPLIQVAAEYQATLGVRTSDLHALDTALERLTSVLHQSSLVPGGPIRMKSVVGRFLCERFRLTGDRRDLNNGIALLKQASRELDYGATGYGMETLLQLAASYRIRDDPGRNDRQRAVETGLAALAEAAAEVALQSDTGRGLQAAKLSAVAATRVVSWCYEDGRIAQAIQALEQGRALVLQVMALAPDIPGLLGAAGREDLARDWAASISRSADQRGNHEASLEIPADTRREVLEVLRTNSPALDLLNPPTARDVAAGVRAAGYDALVYLLPPDLRLPRGKIRPGSALLISAAGEVEVMPLPELTEQPIAVYDQARQAAIAASEDPSARDRWQAALTELCDWAWPAVMGPLLRHLAGWRLGRLPRVALVPTGKLGAVPWHAARTTLADGSTHYAIEDALIGYAASGRQLATASRRERRAYRDRPVLISNPTGDLPLTQYEGQTLWRQFYPDAVVFGTLRDDPVAGPGTPQEVLARLPGGSADEASMLHFSCHATVGLSLAESQLQLAGRQSLTIARIAAQAQGRDPQAPGFLAVLGACMTDLANADHDEALTLASALLAAGASGVVGTRWPTNDLASAELLVMFHHHLNSAATVTPAQALRLAQLWMLDPDRRSIDGLVSRLARSAGRPELAEIPAWAGFTYQGIFG